MAHWTTYVNVSHACASCSIFLGIALAIFSSLLLLLLLSFSIFHSLALAAFIFFLAYTTTYIQRSNSCYLLWFLACFLVLLAVISCYFPTFQKHSSCYLSAAFFLAVACLWSPTVIKTCCLLLTFAP
ncbi:hypothetical protein Tco_1227538 [Tanacetum coccineum]